MLLLLLSTLVPLALSACPSTPNCLPVFTHSPSHLPKCYCLPSTCENSVESFAHLCASGQLHEDGCGICLVCARARGQNCGGRHNILGICAGGLVCKTDAASTAEEQDAVGICVDEDSPDCPKSTDKNKKTNVNCRPGRTGILAEALYCPTCGPPSTEGNRNTGQQTVAQSQKIDTTTRRSRRPGPGTLVDVLLSNIG